MKFVQALNELHINVWAVFILACGVAIAFKHPEIGTTLIGGGFALLRSTDTKPDNGAAANPPQKS